MSNSYKEYASKEYVENKATEIQEDVNAKISFTEQSLTDEQKGQARKNIGASNVIIREW